MVHASDKDDPRALVVAAVRSPHNAAPLAALTDLLVVVHRSRLLRQEGAPADALLLHLVRAGAMRPGDLASAVNLDQSTVSRHLHHLGASGLVAREPDPSDRRAQIATATDAGREHARAVVVDRVRQLERVVDAWSDRDRDELARLLRKFTDEFSAQLDDDPGP